jgi:hypothetical protein
MPLSALPPRLQAEENWKGTDDDVWYMRWRIPLKGLFAYGPLATESWAHWREYPKVLFVRHGKGSLRWESDIGNECICPAFESPACGNVPMYLSAIQYWTKWHFQISWPFFVAFHFYFDEVPTYANRADNKRVLYFRFGARRDADRVYWFPSLFLGGSWN